MERRLKRTLILFLCLVCAIFTAPAGLSSYAAPTEASIKEQEQKIAEQKKQRDALKANMTNLEKVKADLQKSKNDLAEYITELDGNLVEIEEKIKELTGQITEKEAEIEETQAQLQEAQDIQQAQYEAMKHRIRFMYEKGETYYLALLFESDSYADMMNRADYIEQISAYDRMKLDEYVANTNYVALVAETLEEEKETLEAVQEEVRKEQDTVQELLAEKNEQLSGIESEIGDKQAQIDAYKAAVQQEAAEIAALEKAVAADKAALEEANRRQYNGGVFAWPCPKYTRISDDFGMRMHPTLKTEMMHNGVDMAAPYGTPVIAAYDGTVVAAAYSSSMGNYVMIDHGSGLFTVYMHCSSLSVSRGQEVSKGQNIAAVGSTGRSTGNHLHFGVRLNGSYVNPWNYLRS
ncbi:MAG: peptidoglycan DD-metalloendopeptidase family protein [Lachnospiraceae bacterium]|jgi:murein DD-endopeptidase MepM/ murein hydrolase activator NlpD|nr:peptidoglycan DD-metalloendopeptidase family protein [Lachnospiraceae bacterium]